jgi:NAD dependent epimerase/dehydratase family enzyme
MTPDLHDVFHIAASNPETNLAFMKTLGAAMHRPTLLRFNALC